MKMLMQDSALWCFDHEVSAHGMLRGFGSHITGMKPFHCHNGTITLSATHIEIAGDNNLMIPLGSMTQLAHQFDDVYHRGYAKNFGLSWQPLRITYNDNAEQKIIYLIIGFNLFKTDNRNWFETLKSLYE